jgi:protein-L-isoaspartate(D-aspartate) O-methyltransferase
MVFTREDSYKHKNWRKRLIDELRTQEITDERVLAAMMAIPRHFFLDTAFESIAYENRAFSIEADQTISQPYTVAFQTSLLNVQANQKILEIGTGSAYQCTVLAELGAFVYTIERQRTLFDYRAKHYAYKDVYKKLFFFCGDGFLGNEVNAPYDKILITAAAPFVPPKLIEQLKIGGQMVIPVDEGDAGQRMKRITKVSASELQEEQFNLFKFVPMLPGVDRT